MTQFISANTTKNTIETIEGNSISTKILEETKAYVRNAVLNIDGTFEIRKRTITYTTEGIKELAMTLNMRSSDGIYYTEFFDDDDAAVLVAVTEESNYMSLTWSRLSRITGSVKIIGTAINGFRLCVPVMVPNMVDKDAGMEVVADYEGWLADTIDLSELDTSKMTRMTHMFDGCEAHNLILGEFDTSKVESMRAMFRNTRFRNADMFNIDTRNVKDFSKMFQFTTIRHATLSKMDFSNATDISRMFANSFIEELEFRKFNARAEANIEAMFHDAMVLNSIGTDKRILEALSRADAAMIPIEILRDGFGGHSGDSSEETSEETSEESSE